MKWGHPKNSAAVTQAKTAHLKNNAQGFQKENTADKYYDDFLFNQDGCSSQDCSKAEGARITHEYLSGVSIEP
jgi:hypothetical protein